MKTRLEVDRDKPINSKFEILTYICLTKNLDPNYGLGLLLGQGMTQGHFYFNSLSYTIRGLLHA